MDDQQINIVAGMPFGAPGFTPGPDFALVPCPFCGNSMWLGPKQREKVQEGVEPLCMFCLGKKYGPDAYHARVQHLTPDSGSRFTER